MDVDLPGSNLAATMCNEEGWNLTAR